MRQEKEKIKQLKSFKTEKQFNDYINKITDTRSIVSRHYFADSQYTFPTENMYKKLQTTGFFQHPYNSLKKECTELRQEYEKLRQEYEKLRRYFNLTDKLKNDVIKWDQEDHLTRHLNHPTCKPPSLVAELVKICCGLGAKIFEPFTGTETLRKIAYNMGFHYQGCENNLNFWQWQEDRFKNHIANPELFKPETIQKHIYYNQGELLHE